MNGESERFCGQDYTFYGGRGLRDPYPHLWDGSDLVRRCGGRPAECVNASVNVSGRARQSVERLSGEESGCASENSAR